MRTFKEGNWSGDKKCTICGTQKEGEVVLVAIVGKENGNNCEAIQIHLDCLNLWYDDKMNIIYQKLKGGSS